MQSSSNQEENRLIAASKDFFISYNGADKDWAEWIAWQLEEANYSTIIQAWDFHSGNNFVLKMQDASKRAVRTIALLSPDYLKAAYTQPEWAAAFKQDPQGEKGLLIPIMIRSCKEELQGLWGPIVRINLVDLNEEEAIKKLLAGLIEIETNLPPLRDSQTQSNSIVLIESPLPFSQIQRNITMRKTLLLN